MKYQLLCTFTNKSKLDSTLSLILDTYQMAKRYVYILSNEFDRDWLYITYNIEQKPITIADTILVHRKTDTNTIYTINALNELVKLQNNGILDNKFPIEWERYRNSIILYDGFEVKKIPTIIFKIVET